MKGKVVNTDQRQKLIDLILNTKIDRAYHWEWTRKREKKTLSRNNYIWLVLTHVAEEIGDDKHSLYKFILSKFPTYKEVEFMGEKRLVEITLSDPEFTKEKTIVLINHMVIFFLQHGYPVPDPEDQKALDMFDYYQNKGLI